MQLLAIICYSIITIGVEKLYTIRQVSRGMTLCQSHNLTAPKGPESSAGSESSAGPKYILVGPKVNMKIT